MASCNCAFFVFTLFLATSCAAPAEEGDLNITIPTECEGQAFCDIKPAGYDDIEDRINSVIPEFMINEIDDRYAISLEPILSPKEDWHNCPYITKHQAMYTYKADPDADEIDIIVQTKLLRQYVEVVTCATEHIPTSSDEECFQGLNLKEFGLKSSCRTTNSNRTLLIYDAQKHKVVSKTYEVPACCSCAVANNW